MSTIHTIAESVKSKKDIFMASKLALGGALKSREASNAHCEKFLTRPLTLGEGLLKLSKLF